VVVLCCKAVVSSLQLHTSVTEQYILVRAYWAVYFGTCYRAMMLCHWPCVIYAHIQSFYGPFSGTTRVSWCQKKSSSGLYGAREDNSGRHTDHPAGCHSIQTNQQFTSITPHFYAGCPSCCNPPTLSWLGTGTKYAGLHTQWRGYPYVIYSVVIYLCAQWCLKWNWAPSSTLHVDHGALSFPANSRLQHQWPGILSIPLFPHPDPLFHS